MFDRLANVAEHFEDLNNQMLDPNIVTDHNKYAEIMKEYKRLEPIIEKYNAYEQAKSDEADAKEMLNEGGVDKDFKELLEEEIKENRNLQAQYAEELQILLLPTDPNDEKNVIVEIRSGAGGDEASLFAASLYRMYSMYADTKGWKTEILSENPTEVGGYREISFSIDGAGAYSRLKYESGVHRVQRVPETESQGRVHTSTVTVAVLPEVEDVEFEINPSDLKIDTYRAGGAGGQHVNMTDSAVRITHLPTGTISECQDERSQHKNRDKAMKILRSRIYDQMLQAQADEIASERRSQIGRGDRSERIRTYNYPQSRLTDHRINLTIYRLEYILDGDLDEVLDSLATADQAEKLESSQNV